MRIHGKLLNKLLRTLIDEWGYEEVIQELSRIDRHSSETSKDLERYSRIRSKQKAKLNPTEQAERATQDYPQKQALVRLAHRYEQKQFLPSVAAVREFLMMRGAAADRIKDRDQAFRLLLKYLLQLSTDQLEQINRSALYSGPSQLGPISDAIAAAGNRLARRPEETEASEKQDSREQSFRY